MSAVKSTVTKARERLQVVASQSATTTAMAAAISSPMTTHVLNTSTGKPASNLLIKLHRLEGTKATLLKEGRTNSDGRLPGLLTASEFTAGTYMMRFETEDYFKQSGTVGFYPYVEIVFSITNPSEHYHIPLLLSPYGYSTYRGS
ncbi:5-hydroxyisourate hydrolase-like [Watersipora subatra]|uniref:5-hydroxyisourate hydrolase-like n=1 Tax=Watersipora subatra TaxID=2589382 RepID=UPI00355BAD43